MVFGTDLTGKMAVVTGAGGILCGMFARTLAGAGASVALLDINLEAAEKIAGEIRDMGGTASAYEVDVMDKDMLESVHARVLAELGPCDILVNGAGGNQACANTSKEYFEMGDIEGDVVTFFDLEYGGIQKVLDLNFLGAFLTCQVFAKDMVGRDGCNILNISSASAKRPLTRIPVFSGAVAALSNFTQWLAVHFARAGIRVNAIAPGLFVTRQNERLLYEEDGAPAARAAKVLAATPMGRFGKPEELNGALLFLLNNEAAGFITGVVLPVDGGFGANAGV
ncbi:SDR family oxidoreductase [Enterocloster citroniae]|uniref:SDR family oxidoreductase n=1 Tax=Enterocloster citroniae TaxID=358743 RepID=UPI00349EE25A